MNRLLLTPLILGLLATSCRAGTGDFPVVAAETRGAPEELPVDVTAIAERAEELDAGAADAEAAIVSYASDVLGLSVAPLYAGTVTREVNRALVLSAQGQSAQNAVVDLALVSYGAVFANGAAALSYGDGAISGDLEVDINTASLGAYSVLVGGTAPDTETEALTVVLGIFPGLADRAFSQSPASDGYAWRYQGQISGFSAESFQATLVAEAVQIGLATGRGPRGGQAVAYAIVGRGSFASDLMP